MTDALESLSPVEAELLYATCSANGEMVFRDPAWCSVFGDEEDPWARLQQDDKELLAKYLNEAATGVLVTNQIFPVQLPDRDEPLPLLLNFLPVLFSDEASGKTTTKAITVTGEVLAEPSSWTISQTQRHRMETLGRMTMGIIHDFNNLLSAVLGHTELLKSSIANEEAGKAFQEHIRPIEQAALDGAALIRRIQQYIRQEKQTHFEPVNLLTLIDDCVTLMRPYWYNEPRRQGISIQVEQELETVPIVMGSPSELREIFINLILNAVQAMPQGGFIRFQTAYVRDLGVIVDVSDTGAGMSESVRERIFEPLFTTKGKHGTGMGLAVSYGIMQEHEGTIQVESEVGVGTRFRLTFPPADEEMSSEETPDMKILRIKASVLVVDDERMVRTVLSKLLALKGHSVQEASSGAEALALMEDDSFDIVFTDHGMPEMSGTQLARALRRRFPSLPIVMVSGDTELDDTDEYVTARLNKPFKADELDAVIQKLLA